MQRKYDEKGDLSKEYVNEIIKACEIRDEQFFVDRLKQANEYLSERSKYGWPSIKTGDDLNVECQIIPFVNHCLQYLRGELELPKEPHA